jgi:hypothetical protein
MPWWRYVSNRFLTLAENILLGSKLSEFHTGYRAFSRALLERIPFERNSDDFVFDNQMLAQILWLGSRSPRSRARRRTSRRRRRSTSRARCATASAAWAPGSRSARRAWASGARRCSPAWTRRARASPDVAPVA